MHGRLARLVLVAAGLAGCAHSRPGYRAEMRLGARAAELELWREARLRFERALAARPGDARAANALAVTAEAEGRIAEAFEAYRRAVEADPGNRSIRRNLDRFLARHGETVRSAATEPGK